MNKRFFAEFLTVLSRRVNPCPGLDLDCEDERLEGVTDGLKKCQSTLSLHSRILDLTYDPGEDIGGGGEEKKEEEKEDKKEEPKEVSRFE